MDDALEAVLQDLIERTEHENDILSISSINVSESRGFTTEHVEYQLQKGEVIYALILCSTLLEMVFARFIQKRFDISEEEFEQLWKRSSLGRYWQICQVVDALPKDHPEKDIQRLIEERNKLVHDAGYLDRLMNNEEMKSEIASIIQEVIHYINSIKLWSEERNFSINQDTDI